MNRTISFLLCMFFSASIFMPSHASESTQSQTPSTFLGKVVGSSVDAVVNTGEDAAAHVISFVARVFSFMRGRLVETADASSRLVKWADDRVQKKSDIQQL